MISRIKNERGDMSFFSIFIILAINMLLSFVLLYASVQINCINIRNAAKMELNNVIILAVSQEIMSFTFPQQGSIILLWVTTSTSVLKSHTGATQALTGARES